MLRVLAGQEDGHEVKTCVTYALYNVGDYSSELSISAEASAPLFRQSFVASTRVFFHELTEEDIEAYVSSGDGDGKAG